MNHTIRPTSIERATDDDLDDVAGVLAAAFADDPVFAWCLPDERRRAAVLPRFFTLVARAVLPHDEVQLAAGRAAALWVPPDTAPIADDDAPAFEAAMAVVLGDDAPRAFELMALLEAHHPHHRHRYLWFLGTQPAHQGCGLGSALLAQMLDRCDDEGTAAYLEATSAANRRLYERHGFAVVDELTLPSGPTLWSMWRERARPGLGASVRPVSG